MNSFENTIKKHGLIIWLTHFFAMLLTFVVAFCLTIGGLFTSLGVVGTYWSMDRATAERIAETLKSIPEGTLSIISLVVLGGVLLLLLASAFGEAGMIAVTSNAVAKNEAKIKTFFEQGLKYMWRMLGLMLLSVFLYLPTGLLGAVAGVMFARHMLGIGVLLGIVTIILAIVTTLGLLFARYILVIENTSVGQAISGSFLLFRKAFGMVLVTGLISIAIFIATMVLFWGFGDYGALLTPLVMALFTLIFTYRYHRYMKPILYPDAIETTYSDNEKEN